MASGTCGNEALHAELRRSFQAGVQRVLADFSRGARCLPPLDAARRIPMLRQKSQGRVREVSRSAHETSYHPGSILHVV